VGEVLVSDRVDGFHFSGNGMVALTAEGLTANLAPALADPQAFAQALAQGGVVQYTIGEEGTLHGLFGESAYIVQPDWYIEPGTPGAGLGSDEHGYYTWTDGNGERQRLLPAFADLGQLVETFRALDPNTALEYAWRGEVRVTFQGQGYLLTPEYTLTPVPEGREQSPWWSEGERIVVRYPEYEIAGRSGWAQGFTVRAAQLGDPRPPQGRDLSRCRSRLRPVAPPSVPSVFSVVYSG
jgi:hypothetical protein